MNLRQLRFHMGLSVESLAKRLQVVPKTVASRESAPLTNIPLGVVLDHCRATGAEVGLFMIHPDGTKEPIE
jgi:hypothetical protein